IGPGGQAAELPALPMGALGETAHFIELNHHYDDLEPVKGAPYKLRFSDGTTLSGKVDGNGFARHEGVPPGSAKVEWGEDMRKWAAEPQRPNDRFGGATDAQSAIALINSLLS
ncbi:type VI secretion system tip protein VgrG, partial (plasmid) [Ralstonia solanacearum]